MIHWLRPLLMMFYAPSRGMAEVRDRAPLVPSLVVALLAQTFYALYTQWPYLGGAPGVRGVSVMFQSLKSLLFIGFIFVPIIIFVASLVNRRLSFGLMMQQEYASVASTIFYGWAAASLATLPLAYLAKASGVQAQVIEQSVEVFSQWQRGMLPEAQLLDRAYIISDTSKNFSIQLMLPFFGLWGIVAVREVFSLSWLRSLVVLFLSGLMLLPAMFVLLFLWQIFGWLFASPFVLLLLFFLLRNQIGDVTNAARARASFKQNLEAATLNPADASAHYNLGLIHQQRNQLDEARQRFERAIEIDPEEVDAHYQLGRIARAQGSLPDAIKHFEQVVTRDPGHAQYEIWREIGATYIAAGQFEDAREALQRFLDRRQSDAEGLYLMGRAHAGLGHQREAANSMQACIEAVKTAPAYKYRTDKRWLNEAQQFLRSQAL